MKRPEEDPMTDSFREIFDAVRGHVLGPCSRVAFAGLQAKHLALEAYVSVEKLLEVMGSESEAERHEREAVTRALLAGHKAEPRSGVCASLLLLSYYPMLSRLRHRIYGQVLEDEDLDQLVVSCFLEVASEFDLDAHADRTALRLRQRTARRVFRGVRLEQGERRGRIVLEEEGAAPSTLVPFAERSSADVADPEGAVARLLDVAGVALPKRSLDLVVATMLGREQLRAYAARTSGAAANDERAYQRLKRRRSRAVSSLRGLFAKFLSPQSETWGL